MKHLRLSIIALMAIGLAACGGNTQPTSTVTVTATPTPTMMAPYFTDLELEGLDLFAELVPKLEHILETENDAVDYGASTGSLAGIRRRVNHYVDDYSALQRIYNKSNGGDRYGGELAHLETLFEKAAEHIRRAGVILGRIVYDEGGSPTVAGEQLYYADQDMKKLIAELMDLQSKMEI